jgi:hypothetical protein
MSMVRMWEARCASGRTAEAVAWVQQRVVPSARAAGAVATEVFRSEDRVVLLTRWPASTGWTEPTPDPAIVERCHAWPFEAVPDN